MVSLSNHLKQPNRLRPFDKLRMHGPFDRLRANGVIVWCVGRMGPMLQFPYTVNRNPFVVSLSNHRKQPDKLRPFDELRMLGPFDKLSANGVVV